MVYRKDGWKYKTSEINAFWKSNLWNYFAESIRYHQKNDSIKNVLDARRLNSNIDQSSESWPMEPIGQDSDDWSTQPAMAFKKQKSATGLMYAYTH